MAFDQFAAAFRPPDTELPPGWVRFDMLRGLADENEVVTFGFFDGTLEELERSQEQGGYRERREAVDTFVESVVTNGIYDVVVDWTAAKATA